ncbi:hypothetical protein [Hominifimenecus sp. rT4P-3]|uniref:hypothetical protein n=1 Tax=Hominifimenecus sp. rT4P-3 TaxID=3242979 RepID=UPI003DA1EF12
MSVKLSSRVTVYDRYAISKKFTAQQTAINMAQGSIDLIASRSEIGLLKNGNKTMYSWLSQVALDLDSITLAVSSSKYKDIDGVLTAISQAQASIIINTENIALKVSKDSIVSSINQSAEAISINANKINLNGIVTANNGFKILTDGSMVAAAGEIGGWNISKAAIYKDVTISDGTTYRAYFQPPQIDLPERTWVLSCQKKVSGGNRYIGNFILYSDGSAQFGAGNLKIDANGVFTASSSYLDNVTLTGSLASLANTYPPGLENTSCMMYGGVLRIEGGRIYFGAYSDNWWNTLPYIGYYGNSKRLKVSDGLHVEGYLSCTDLTCTGAKSRVVNTPDYGWVRQSAYETAEPLFGDLGHGIIAADGKCTIPIEPKFCQTVSTEYGYYVFLEKYGPGNLWIETKGLSGFVVCGDPGMEFDWEVKAHQKGYEKHRLESADIGTSA